jgi:hypothetical protein
MDIEFHYYMTYLIAVRAGFSTDEAAIIAQSAQEVDDNHIPISVSKGKPEAYDGIISQTMDILRPQHNERIYPIFHFIPGDPQALSARRKDASSSLWVTTPNSDLANEMLDTALKSKNLYRIGASSHAFADTWAHQNFLGKDDAQNEMPPETLVERVEEVVNLMRIGHALAAHLPDIPSLLWTDGRLLEPAVDNTERFMDAADHLYRKFALYKNPTISADVLKSTSASLTADLRADIGPASDAAKPSDQGRIGRYKQRALRAEYGGKPIPEYVEAKWADAAFNEARESLVQQLEIMAAEKAGTMGDILAGGVHISCTWKNPAQRQQTDWYKFQEAIKAHLDECWGVLGKRLPDLIH